ncbi:MAG TPA: D-alanyl-D-alanine carboxypeptidase family protein [Patescibacteria group bacterium]|jgi:D-alanyl-D-alanine carboxypeptidase (penicillin-binding protein 5/6)|nr:D-alanyl-D-alanine carboxypeptidase family protein [Patescibacteria group bacterium]
MLVFLLLVPGIVRAEDTIAKQAIMLDYDTGTVLLEKNADDRMTPSSMSKEMTMYMVFEALKDGKITLDQTLPVSERAWRMQKAAAGASVMFVKLGSQVRVEDLVRGVIIQSGNDAAITLAEGLGGTEDNFALMMNKKAEELGMKNSHFMNASGWPEPEHYSTARDLSTLAFRMIHDFPEYYHYYSELDFSYNNIKQGNRNPLLYDNIGGDGLKTGHTEDGGYGLMGSGKLGNRRVIFVINGLDSMKARAQEGARLLQWGLKTFENVRLFKPGETIEKAPVVFGQAEEVPLTVDKDLLVTLPLAAKKDIKVSVDYQSPLKAPVKKGQEVGKVHIELPNGMPPVDQPLIAAEGVEKLGFFQMALAKAKLLIAGKHSSGT